MIRFAGRLAAIALCLYLANPSCAAADEANDKKLRPNAARYADVVRQLKAADVPLRQRGTSGKVAVTLAGGRVVAMAFSEKGENLFWTNPNLSNRDLVKNHPEKLVGGIGGDRLWFAPELAYHWDGSPNWKTFANYKVPKSADPGKYRFIDVDSDAIALAADVKLKNLKDDSSLAFHVTRMVRLVDPPLPRTDAAMKDIDYIGIEMTHHLKLDKSAKKGVVDMWHLLQVPVDSTLILPIRKGATAEDAKPVSYALDGSWLKWRDDPHVMWLYKGTERAKFGMSARAVTGRCGVIRKLDNGKWCLLVRQFSFDAKAKYCDHPYGKKRDDQVFQAWDGYGFGEVEFHSPAVNAVTGPREISDEDSIWAFAGTSTAITNLARKLLKVDVAYVFGG